jgi:hypothetical protein
MSRFSFLAVAAAIVLVGWSTSAHASIIFDDFNTNEGHFNQAPTFSGTTNTSTASTADRITTGAFEGVGCEEVVAVMSTANPARIRFVSGNGTMSTANNVIFTTGPGTDGFIGFYYKTSTAGLKLQLNLDGDTVGDTGSAGATSELDGSPVVSTVGDGAWHLAEFNLDATTGWGASTGLGGGHGGVILDGNHSIDSIMISSITAGATIDFDFVAKSDSGTIAALVPEPASLSLFGVAAIAGFARRRKR